MTKILVQCKSKMIIFDLSLEDRLKLYLKKKNNIILYNSFKSILYSPIINRI